MYLVSAYFDEKTNMIVQRYIDQIAEKTGNGFMKEHKVPPHMTISAIEARNIEVLIAAFQTFRRRSLAGIINHCHGCHM